MNKFPTGYLSGVVTVDIDRYCSSIEGVKHRKQTATLN